jgi:PhnB protein
MQMTPYLSFDGTCEEAFRFYEQALGGKIQSLNRYESTPMADKVPQGWGQKIIHGLMHVDGQTLMGADVPPGQYEKPNGFSLTLEAKSADESERLFRSLAEGGQIRMPMQQTFWALRFGMLVDQFGVPWMINCPLSA